MTFQHYQVNSLNPEITMGLRSEYDFHYGCQNPLVVYAHADDQATTLTLNHGNTSLHLVV